MMEGSDAQPRAATADDEAAWAARLGWARGLIATDPVERSAALLALSQARERPTRRVAAPTRCGG